MQMTKDLERKYKERFEKKRARLLSYDKKHHAMLLDQKTEDFSLELLQHRLILEDQVHWEIRGEYLELFEKYVEKKLSGGMFRVHFCERYESIEEVANFLELNRILLSPNKNSSDFGTLLSDISSCCEICSDDPEPYRQSFEITEIEFRNIVEKIYLQLKKLDQDSNFNDVQILQFTMTFLTGILILFYSIINLYD